MSIPTPRAAATDSPFFTESPTPSTVAKHPVLTRRSSGHFRVAPTANHTIHKIWYQRGKMLVEQHRYEQAITSFDTALALQPSDVNSWVFKGVALMRLGYNQSALASFQKALVLAPDHREAWIFQGTVLRAMDRQSEAIGCFRAALVLQQYAIFPETASGESSNPAPHELSNESSSESSGESAYPS
jgi:tetratricopeptide (TPR) repeat protein